MLSSPKYFKSNAIKTIFIFKLIKLKIKMLSYLHSKVQETNLYAKIFG